MAQQVVKPFASAVLFVALGCAPPPSAPPRPTWSVAQGFIRDGDGRAVIMRGANVAGRHKELPFFDFHGPAEWQHMREVWGMNTVRFLVSWAAIEPTQGTFDETYLANGRRCSTTSMRSRRKPRRSALR